MKKIKDFINGYNIDHIPIGPQADLLEKLEYLNQSVVPWQFRMHDSRPDLEKRGFPAIKLNVNKKFKWERGSYNKIETLKDYFLGVFKYKGFSYGKVENIWEKENRLKRDYYFTNFKRHIMSIDNLLKEKREDNAIWIDNNSELDELKANLYSSAYKKVEEYISYVKMFNKLSVIDFKYHETSSEEPIHNGITQYLKDLWRKTLYNYD